MMTCDRSKRATILAIALSLLLVLATAIPGWSQEPISLRIDQVDDSGFPEMVIRVTVRGINGVPVLGLTTEDFEILEDGISPALKPREVIPSINPEVQIAVALVIDVSGSMKGKPLEDAKAAANAFLERLAGQDRAAVIAFSEAVDLGQPFPRIAPNKEHPFTRDKNAVRNVINFLEAGGGTPLYDAAFKAVKMTAQEPLGNRAVILLTDGRDEKTQPSGVIGPPGSEIASADDPISEANRNRIPVFTIGLGQAIDEAYLRRLALRTGGTYQASPDSSQLAILYENIADQLKQQYVLRYRSNIDSPGEHSLLLRAIYGGAEAFHEVKVTPIAPPAPTPTATAEPPSPTPEPAATPTPTPTPTRDVFTITIPGDGTVEVPRPIALVGGGVLGVAVLVLLILIVWLVVRGRREEEYVEPDTGLYPTPITATPPEGTPFIPSTPPSEFGLGTEEETRLAELTRPGRPTDTKTRILKPAPKYLGFLVMKQGDRPGEQFGVRDEMVTIGRGGYDVPLNDTAVSRPHARVKVEDGQFYIYDLASSNGTFVNGQQIVGWNPLRDGDEVKMGETVLVFKLAKLEG